MFHNLNFSFLFSNSYKLKRRSKELLMILNFYIYYFKKIKTCHCDIYAWQRAFFQNILSILSWRTILCFQAKIQWYSSPTERKQSKRNNIIKIYSPPDLSVTMTHFIYQQTVHAHYVVKNLLNHNKSMLPLLHMHPRSHEFIKTKLSEETKKW